MTAERSNHLVIDAGRVLVESALADKETIREIEKKRNTQYTDDDYRRLESMMYDNYSVKLIAAQVWHRRFRPAIDLSSSSSSSETALRLAETLFSQKIQTPRFIC